jgi:hypothetical protein
VLHPKGNYEAPEEVELASPLGLSRCTIRWKVVELWTLSAEDLLQAGDVGLVPWVPLAKFDGPPEQVVRRCREIIDRAAPSDEHKNLLAVTQVMTGLRYNDPGLLKLLGGTQAMLESPLIEGIVAERVQEVVAHSLHDAILTALERRFGSVPADLEAEVRKVVEEQRLRELNGEAAVCADLESFRAHLRE